MDARKDNESKVVIAVTPTKNRQVFIERQHDAFWKPYQEYAAAHPDAPALKWIIVDESAQPSEFYKNTPPDGITYLHVPDRDNLSTVPEQYRSLVSNCIYDADDLAPHIETLKETTLSDRFILAHSPNILSIGEMRNIGINIAHALYGHLDPGAAVFAKDDDDFSSVEAISAAHDALQDHSFAKFGTMHVYNSVPRQWHTYSIKNQDEPTHVIEKDKHAVMDRYVVWDDKAETRENPYKHLGIYGCTFSYRLDDAVELGQRQGAKYGVFSPFEPLSRREDVAFFEAMVNHFGIGNITVIDNPGDWMVRIVHNNETRTMHHGDIDVSNVAPATQHYVDVLCGLREGPAPGENMATRPAPVVSLLPPSVS